MQVSALTLKTTAVIGLRRDLHNGTHTHHSPASIEDRFTLASLRPSTLAPQADHVRLARRPLFAFLRTAAPQAQQTANRMRYGHRTAHCWSPCPWHITQIYLRRWYHPPRCSLPCSMPHAHGARSRYATARPRHSSPRGCSGSSARTAQEHVHVRVLVSDLNVSSACRTPCRARC
jgi:hypothetical protein